MHTYGLFMLRTTATRLYPLLDLEGERGGAAQNPGPYSELPLIPAALRLGPMLPYRVHIRLGKSAEPGDSCPRTST